MRMFAETCCVLLLLLTPRLATSGEYAPVLLPGQPPDSFRRTLGLQHDVQVSAAILVGTIIDTTMSEMSDGWIYTRYGVAVDTLVAGPRDMPPEIHFLRMGGHTGRRSTWVSSNTPLLIGRTYLLCLIRCGEETDYTFWDSGCGAEVAEGVARPTRASHTSPLPALLDTLATYAKVRTPEFQKSQSDAVVLAYVRSVEYTDTRMRDYQSPATLGVQVDSVLWSRGDSCPPVSTGPATLIVRPQFLVEPRFGLHNPHVLSDAQYLLFLQWRDGAWVLAPTMYSAWRRDDDNAVVLTHGGPCGRSSIIASTQWTTLMSRLR